MSSKKLGQFRRDVILRLVHYFGAKILTADLFLMVSTFTIRGQILSKVFAILYFCMVRIFLCIFVYPIVFCVSLYGILYCIGFYVLTREAIERYKRYWYILLFEYFCQFKGGYTSFYLRCARWYHWYLNTISHTSQHTLNNFTSLYEALPALTGRLIRHIVHLAIGISESRSNLGVLNAISIFLLENKSLFPLTTINDYVTRVLNKGRSVMVAQSGDNSSLFEQWKGLIDGVDGGINSHAYRTLRKIILFVVASTITNEEDKEIFINRFDKYEIREYKENDSVSNLISIVKSVNGMIANGMQYLNGDISFKSLIHSGNSYVAWYEIASKRLDHVSKFCTEPNYPLPTDILSQLEESIKQGNEIITLNAGVRNVPYIGTLVTRLEKSKAVLSAKLTMGKTRKEPLGVLIHGPPQNGKSLTTQIVRSAYKEVYNVGDIDAVTYNKNAHDKFFTGMTNSTKVMILDDVASRLPNSGETDTSLDELLNIISPLPYSPNMAAVEEKGSVTCLVDIVIATTNTRELNARHNYSNSTAFIRRFPYVINTYVLSQFASDNDNPDFRTIDKAKVSAYRENNPGVFFDVTEYEIVTPVIRDNIRFDDKPLHEGRLSSKQLYEYIKNIIKAHKNEQDKFTINYDVVAFPECICMNHVPFPLCERCSLIPRNLWSLKNDMVQAMLLHDNGDLVLAGIDITPYLEHFDATSYTLEIVDGVAQISSEENLSERIKTKLRDLGNTASDFFLSKYGLLRTSKEMALGLGVLSATAMVIYKMTQKKEETVPMRELSVNNTVWETYFKKSVQYDTTARPTHYKHFIPRFMHDCIRLYDGTKFIHGIPFKGQYYLFPSHFFTDGVWEKRYRLIDHDLTMDMTITLDQTAIFKSNDDDVCLVLISDLPPTRDYSGYFLEKDEYDNRPAPAKMFKWSGKEDDYTEVDISIGKMVNMDYWHGDDKINSDVIGYDGIFENGDCGSPIIIKHKNRPIIVGFHTAYTPSRERGYGIIADPCSLEVDLKRSFDVATTAQGGSLYSVPQAVFKKLPINAYGKYKKIVPLHPKSFLHRFPRNVHVFGTISDFERTACKGSVQKTEIASLVDKFWPYDKPEYCQPIMRPVVERGEYFDPVAIGYQHSMNSQNQIPPAFLFVKFRDFFRKEISSKVARKIRPLTIHEAINGVDGDPYIKGLNMATSAGYPFKGPKSNLFHVEVDSNGNNVYSFTEEQQLEYDRIIASLRKGERYCPIFNTCPKDEALPKRKEKKTRLFASSMVVYNIIMRQYYLPLLKLVRENPLLFCNAVGINPRSQKWKEFKEFLSAFGEQFIVAGDYSKFDKKMAGRVITAAFVVLHDLAMMCGYSFDSLKIMDTMAFDVAFPVFNSNGDVHMFNGVNPSGHSLTVEINSIVNLIYVTFAFSEFYDLESFMENVHLLTYGDDNIMGVSPDVPLFHHTSLQAVLAKVGIPYTMADKDADSVPYINISEADFLKRRFVTVDSQVLAPLSLESIYKGLTYRTAIKNEEYEHTHEILVNAQIEAYAHRDPKLDTFFDQMREELPAHSLLLCKEEIECYYHDIRN